MNFRIFSRFIIALGVVLLVAGGYSHFEADRKSFDATMLKIKQSAEGGSNEARWLEIDSVKAEVRDLQEVRKWSLIGGAITLFLGIAINASLPKEALTDEDTQSLLKRIEEQKKQRENSNLQGEEHE